MEGADQIGVEAGRKVGLGHPMQCAQANVPDAVRECRGQHLVRFGHLENVARSGHAGAVSDHLKVAVAVAAGQALALPAGHDQSPACLCQPGRHRLTQPACRSSDQELLFP
jgi:hypothetical protein